VVDRQIAPAPEIPGIPPIGATPPIEGIPPLGGVGGIPTIEGITDVPGISPPGMLGFKFGDLPPSVQPLAKKGTNSWPKALDEAIAKGVTDLDKLADLIFFMHHPERVRRADGVGKDIDPDEKGAVRLLAEREYHKVVAQRRLSPSFQPSVFLPEKRSGDYEKYIAAKTTGRITPMINGRNRPKSGKPDEVTEAFKDMQASVSTLGSGDSIYLAGWEFTPYWVLADSSMDWGFLLRKKAQEGVRIRVIVSIHPQIATYDFTPLDDIIRLLPPDKVDNLQYLASRHPGAFMFGIVPAADHHQKFMIVKKGKATIAWCGGLDITQARVPKDWTVDFVWHDIHARLEGKIVKDLEREFVERWNREKDAAMQSVSGTWSARSIVPIWKKGLQTLTASPVQSEDSGRDINTHEVQMLRTVATPGPVHPITHRDDIWRAHHRLIGRAKSFLFLENQYIHEPRLAAALVTQMQAQPSLIVMIVIATGNNDPATDDYTRHSYTMRFEFFRTLLQSDPALANRIAVYTMFYRQGIVHSKLIIADDEALSLGSANASQRSFYLDSELNVMLENPKAVKDFRVKLWAHDLGEPATDVEKWSPSQFIQQWNKVADFNKARRTKPATMVGEGIDRYVPLSWDDPKSIRKAMKQWSKVIAFKKQWPDIDVDIAF
jgi:phosphatidylserine/phosphatidylglycerophosphate/cardiolipin synthase-like enzyme